MTFSEKMEKHVLDTLNKKCKCVRCPSCNTRTGFLLLTEKTRVILHDNREVDTITVLCQSCGYVMEYSTGILKIREV
jgi:RNase P subunit RPR2